MRAEEIEPDGPLADAVAGWLATDWPLEPVDRCGSESCRHAMPPLRLRVIPAVIDALIAVRRCVRPPP